MSPTHLLRTFGLWALLGVPLLRNFSCAHVHISAPYMQIEMCMGLIEVGSKILAIDRPLYVFSMYVTVDGYVYLLGGDVVTFEHVIFFCSMEKVYSNDAQNVMLEGDNSRPTLSFIFIIFLLHYLSS